MFTFSGINLIITNIILWREVAKTKISFFQEFRLF